jgi:hypothetical protein
MVFASSSTNTADFRPHYSSESLNHYHKIDDVEVPRPHLNA